MPDFKVPNSDTNIFLLESKAYRRLKEKGLSARGVVPKFYGSIKRIQPQHWKPHLDMFLNDVLPPNAILIEHIPHLHQLDLSTYSKDRMDKLVSILRDIHKAGILHGDPYPRNMMVARGNPDRVLWIDFDRAQLLPATLTARQQELVDDENEMVDYFAKMIVSDDFELCALGFPF
jgi:Lipopolysaccharide kinase (Kdo/WaaP) family